MNRERASKQRPRSARPSHAIVLECVSPDLDAGRFAVKRVVGDRLIVGADVFKDGHDLIAARIRYRAPGENEWRYAPMTHDPTIDRWGGSLLLDTIGAWRYTVEAWTDVFGTKRSGLGKKIGADQVVALELLEIAQLVDVAARRSRFGEVRTALKTAAATLANDALSSAERASVALSPQLEALMAANLLPTDLTAYTREHTVWVDRERAVYGAWYELFPRSQTDDPARHGTFADASRALPRVAELGFDVVYLPPIHPVGTTNRKGRNNALVAGSSDPGSPWAIGNEHGGHDAVDPRLGTIDDFDAFVAAAATLRLEIALDYALQCSPDHPWLTQHPEWFFVRPDGTIKYAENPPKKYQDIYPLNFWCDDREGLWNACRDILTFWIEHGVRTFRVDNPHTKPFAFWEWVIDEVHREHADVVFLAEAFTRPKVMKHLGKLGFSQSYTYFTWRNSAHELRDYVEELAHGGAREYFRANFFANTPDILHEYLAHGGRPAFRIRLLLAATLGASYGIYSGYELCENVPLKPGSEEYLHSEKYELKPRDWNAPGNIQWDVAIINRIRRENRALHHFTNVSFHDSGDPNILFYKKSAPDADNQLLIAVTADPHATHETMVTVPVDSLGLGREQSYVVQDLLTGASYQWRGAQNYVRLDPGHQVGHIFRISRG
ncbi:MAG: alpha-1,4-glucan--maltose-1-phosphate maltosyltransferase [Gemmatimonadaceae bacterium]